MSNDLSTEAKALMHERAYQNARKILFWRRTFPFSLLGLIVILLIGVWYVRPEIYQELFSALKVKINSTPAQVTVELPSYGCQTITISDTADGIQIDPIPTIGNQPQSWCPSDVGLWKTTMSRPAAQKMLAVAILERSKVDETWTDLILGLVHASGVSGRLDLPGSQVPSPTATFLPVVTDTPIPTDDSVFPTSTPSPIPTQNLATATPSIWLISHKVDWPELGDFMSKYGLTEMSGSIPCQDTRANVYKLWFGASPDDYVETSLYPSWFPNWEEGAVNCELKVSLEMVNQPRWLVYDSGYTTLFSMYPFVRP